MKNKINGTLAKAYMSPQLKHFLFVFMIFIFEVVIFGIGSEGKFISKVNIMNASVQVSVIVLIALAQMGVIITTGIDLSIGTNIGLAGLMAALSIVNWGLPIPVGILIGICAATIIGILNGLFIIYLKITPFIVTFVMQCIVRGSIYLILGNQSSIFGLPEGFTFIGSANIFGLIPMPVIIVAVIAAVFVVLVSKTKTGRYIYATGSNLEATHLSGINTKRVIVTVYAMSGFLAGITGIIAAARLGAATAQSGMNAELDAVAAAVIGGTSLLGGEGFPLAAIVGALIIGTLANGLTLVGVSGNWQLVFKGLVVLIAAALDIFRKRTKKMNLEKKN